MKQIAFSYAGVKSVKRILLILLIITGCAAPPPKKTIIISEPLKPPVAIFNPDTVSELIQGRITESSGKKRFTCRSERICGISLLPSFYQQRKFSPAWMGKNGDSKKLKAAPGMG